MDYNEYFIRTQRTVAALACFLGAVFLVYRGNNFGTGNDFSLLVPVMCVLTALSLFATGIGLMLRSSQKAAEDSGSY